jgi:hypothetical protein
VPPSSKDFGNDLLVAKERDLRPLLAECEGALGLAGAQLEIAADFLDLAWFAGARSGRDRMEARATQPEPDLNAIAVEHFEEEFRELLEQSAEILDLELPAAIALWGLMHQAWLAGNRTCEVELYGLYLELKSDVAEEALRWLENRDGTP